MSGDIYTTDGLRTAGWTWRRIEQAVSEGKLHRVVRGVYTSAPPRGMLLLRAVLVAFPDAIFCHSTAAELILERDITAPIHVLRSRKAGQVRSDLVVTHILADPRGVTTGRFPTVTAAHAAAQLIDDNTADHRHLARRLLERAYKGKNGEHRLDRDLNQLPKRSRAFKELLATSSIGADSELERTLFRRLRQSGYKVQQNYVIAGYRFDGLVGTHIIVEVDSYQYHSAMVAAGFNETQSTFMLDRWKANIAQRLGYIVLRYTDMDIDYHLESVEAQIEDTIKNCRSRRAFGVKELLRIELEKMWTWHHALKEEARYL